MQDKGGLGRIAYLDSVRGFSMVLVVFGHVLFQSLGLVEDDSFLNLVLTSFRMPMFFFVSGFVAYRPLKKWTNEYARGIFKRKFQAQIVGTVFFYSLLLWCLHAEDPFKAFRLEVGGYWFTLTLFRVFAVYALLSLCFRHRFGAMRWVLMGIISVGGAFMYLYQPINSPLFSLFGYNTLYFIQFFSLGLLFRHYEKVILSALVTNASFAMLSVLFVLSSILAISYQSELTGRIGETGYFWFKEEWLRYVGLLLVFALFYYNRDALARDTRFNRLLRLIGRRTLDIYFIHYFFLPDLLYLKPYIEGATNAVVPQLIIGGIVTSVIVAVCLLISYVFRRSAFLSQWLFGVKPSATRT